jgi:hypothetical protein
MIYGASKLSGRLADGWTIGTLQAITAPNSVPIVAADGSHTSRVVSPLSAWNVVRLRRDIGDNAYVGVTATNVTRAEKSGDYPAVPGSPGQSLCPVAAQGAHSTVLTTTGARCFPDAYVAGADFRWRSPGGDWSTAVQAVGSMLDHGPARNVPDGTVIHPGQVGTGAGGYFAKDGGEHFVGDVWGGYTDKYFDNNDVGFNQRGNVYWDGFDLEYRTLDPSWKLLETHTRLEYWDNASMNGLNLGRGLQANTAGRLENFWRYFADVHWRPARYDDREFGDGSALERTAVMVGVDGRISTDTTKPVYAMVHARPDALEHGGYNLTLEGDLLVKVLPELDVDLAPQYTANVGEPRYVSGGSVPGEYLLGHLDAKSLGATLRATYTFTPRLTLTAYAQLFLASGHYSGFLSYLPQAGSVRPLVHLADLRPATPPFSNPDFEQGALNANVVLRWEYRLGSLLYLVYQRAQVPNVSLAPGEQGVLDLGSVGRAPAADVFILKVSYWWG